MPRRRHAAVGALMAGCWLLGPVLTPGPALAYPNTAVIILQPASATGPAWGSQRKLFRLGNAAGSLVALAAGPANELHLLTSNTAGTTWTDSVVRGGVFGSVTVFSFGAALDAVTNDIHVVWSQGPLNEPSPLGYAVGTYAPAPSDPTYSWSVTLNSQVSGNIHYNFPSLAIASAGGNRYLHLVYGQKEDGGGVKNKTRWNFRQIAPAPGGWLCGLTGRDLTITEITSGNSAVGHSPGPIPSVIADEVNRVWTTWWDAGGHFYIRRIPLSGTVWMPDALPFAKFTAGANDTLKYDNVFPAGAMHSVALRAGGGQIGWVLPGSVAGNPTAYQLVLNSTSSTSWSGPGSAPVIVTGLNATTAGDGYPSVACRPGDDWFVFMRDSGARSRGSIVFHRWRPDRGLSAKTTLWDDVANTGNRNPCADANASAEVGVIWSASQTGTSPSTTGVRYMCVAPPVFPAAVSVSASELCQGTLVTVTLTVTNTGNFPLLSATPYLDLATGAGPGATFLVVSAPVAATVPPGGIGVFAWTLSATGVLPAAAAIGSVSVTASITGTYAGGLERAGAAGPVLTVHAPSRLYAAASISATTLSTGQVVSVVLTVTCVGGVRVAAVAPAVSARMQSGGTVTLAGPSGPVPASADLLPGTAAVFAWSWTVAGVSSPGSGTMIFSVTVTGIQSLCGGPVSATLTTAPVAFQRAAALDGRVVAAAPDPSCVGSQLLVSQTITNTGVAAARLVIPAATPFVSGTGGAVLGRGPGQTAWLPGGASVNLVYVMNATAEGTVQFTVTATAVDANSGAAITTGPATSGPIAINAPGTGSTLRAPSQVSLGQWFEVSLTVTNNGSTEVTGATPTMLVAGGGGLIDWVAGPVPPGPVSIPPGGTMTFSWTYSASGTGVVAFFAAVSGVSCGTGSIVAILHPAALAAAASSIPSVVDIGQQFTVVLTVSNTGEAPARDLAPAPVWNAGGAGIQRLAGPSPAVLPLLPGGAAGSFTWTYSATGAGVVQFSVSAGGTDALSGKAVGALPAVSGPLTIQWPGDLYASVSVTPAIVCVGKGFLVMVSVTNSGEATVEGVTAGLLSVEGSGAAIPAGGPFPPGPVVLSGGASVVFTWTMTASVIGPLSFTTTVTGWDATSGMFESTGPTVSPPVSIDPAARLEVAVAAPASVSVGQWYETTITVTNTGDGIASGVHAGLGAGALVPEVAPIAGPLDLTSGGSTTFVWTWSATGNGQVVFTATATGADSCGMVAASAAAAVAIQTPSALLVSVDTGAGSFNVGQPIDVVVTVENTGQATASAVDAAVPLPVGSVIPELISGPIPPPPVSLPGGGGVSFTWRFTCSVTGWVEFGTTATGRDSNTGIPCVPSSAASAPVALQTPAVMAGSLGVSPDLICQGRVFTVTLTLTNMGEAQVTGIQPSPFLLAGSGGAAVLAGPGVELPFDLAGGGSISLTWTLTADHVGDVWFSQTAAGSDANDGADVTSGTVTSGMVTVTPGASLSAAAAAPPAVSVGQWFEVTLTVTNAGNADSASIVPDIVVGAGSSLVVQQGAVSPAAGLTIPAGGSTTFVWTFSASGAGAMGFGAVASGIDLCGASAAVGAGGVVIQAAAALGAAVSVSPNPVNVGQTIRVVVTVTNTGEAGATGVGPSAPLAAGGAPLNLASGPVPAGPVDLAGGESAAFTWEYTAGGPGTADFSLTVTGTDVNTNAPAVAGFHASSPLAVVTPASLVAAASVGAPVACLGKPLAVRVTVTNTGGAAAGSVWPAPPVIGGTAAGSLAGPWPASSQSVASGASVTFTWTFTASAAGSVDFTATVGGVDANDGETLSSGPATAGPVTATAGAALAAAATAPSLVPIGSSFTVTLTVTNNGDDPATAVAPSLAFPQGASLVQVLTVPGTVGTLQPGGSATFVWTLSAAGGGLVTASPAVAGSDSCGPAAAGAAASVTIFTAGRLFAIGSVAPARMPAGELFEVRLTVSETAGGSVHGLVPALVDRSAATLIVVSGPTPAGPLDLGAHGSATFAWTISAAGTGLIELDLAATGLDGKDGTLAQAGTSVSGTVLTAPTLLVDVAASPSRIAIGRTVTVVAQVANAGQIDAVGVTARIEGVDGSGRVVQVDGPVPATAPIASGGTASFTWTYRAVRGGIVRFRAAADMAGPGDPDPGTSGDVLIDEAGAGLDSLVAYPNPFDPARDGSLIFRFMPPRTKVTLYTLLGNRIREETADENGTVRWDGRNGDGSLVITGVYFYIAKSPDGKKKRGTVHVRR